MSTATDERVDLGVDLDAEVPCALDVCDAVAEWRLILIPCRHTWVYCTEHVDHQLKAVRTWIDGAQALAHVGCPKLITDVVKAPL